MGAGSKFLGTGAIIAGLAVFGPASCTATWKTAFDNPDEEPWHTLFSRDFTRFSANILGGIAGESKDILEENGLTIPDLPDGFGEEECDRETLEGCHFDDFDNDRDSFDRDGP